MEKLNEKELKLLTDLLIKAGIKPFEKSENDIFIFELSGKKDIKYPIIPIPALTQEEAMENFKDIIKDNIDALSYVEEIYVSKIFALKESAYVKLISSNSKLDLVLKLRKFIKDNEELFKHVQSKLPKNIDDLSDKELLSEMDLFIEGGDDFFKIGDFKDDLKNLIDELKTMEGETVH